MEIDASIDKVMAEVYMALVEKILKLREKIADDADKIERILSAAERCQDTCRAKDEENAALEMQAKRDSAEISMLKQRIRSLVQTHRKRKKARKS